jgi:acetyl esterase/lipase
MTSSEDILTIPPPPADARLAYGADSNQFGDLRLPKTKGPFPVVMTIHGGFWRAKYDLAHAGHLCAALTAKGIATWNVEYRRVGNAGGGWPGTFEDIRNAYRYLPQIAKRYDLDSTKVLVMGHSAGGQLALCLAAHESSLRRVVSLAGVVDLQKALEQQAQRSARALSRSRSNAARHRPCHDAMAHPRRRRRRRPVVFQSRVCRAKEKEWRGCALHRNLNRRPFRPDRSPLDRVVHSRKHCPPPAGLTTMQRRAWPSIG